MNYCKLKKYDTANGFGVCTSLYVSGCRFHCEGCHNKEAWDFNYGEEFTKSVLDELLEMVNDPNVDGFCLLGGEPLQQPKELIIELLTEVRKTGKQIHLWTGYTIDRVDMDILKLCDTVVDGQFELDKRSLSLEHCGSTNQIVYEIGVK